MRIVAQVKFCNETVDGKDEMGNSKHNSASVK